MGKGTIIGNLGAGQYSVQLNYNRDRLDAEISTLNGRITIIDAAIAAADPGSTSESLLKLKKASYQKRLDLLNNLPEDPTISAWCGDYTEDLAGAVGTIEIPGEYNNGVNILPGYDGAAVYDSERDGALVHTLAQDPAAVFYNLAMMPGWQKWKPLYRYGVISNIDTGTHTCDVAMDATLSSQQSLDVNESASFEDVPITYMDCDSAAFENGDHVLVEFNGQDYEDPLVVGFFSDPAPCGFMFEPWGETLCATEPLKWWVEYYDETPPVPPDYGFFWQPCVDVPHTWSGTYGSLEWNMIEVETNDWALYGRFTNNNPGYANYTGMGLPRFAAYLPDLDVTPVLVIKSTATAPTNSNYYTYVDLFITANGRNRHLIIANAQGPFAPTSTRYYIGDNGGEEMQINLKTLLGASFSGQLTRFVFILNADGSDTVTLTNEYIDFIAAP